MLKERFFKFAKAYPYRGSYRKENEVVTMRETDEQVAAWEAAGIGKEVADKSGKALTAAQKKEETK